MDPLTQWLKTYKLKAFVSEFGGDNTTSVRSNCLASSVTLTLSNVVPNLIARGIGVSFF